MGKVVLIQWRRAVRIVVLAIFREELRDLGRDGLFDHFVKQWPRVVGIDRVIAEAIDHFALFIHHVVEIERALANHVIALLHALLRRFHRLIEPRMLQLLAFLEPEAFHHLGHAIGRAEAAHEIILKAHVEAGETRVALAGATSAKLTVDTARLMPFRADHIETADLGHAGAEVAHPWCARPAMLVEAGHAAGLAVRGR